MEISICSIAYVVEKTSEGWSYCKSDQVHGICPWGKPYNWCCGNACRRSPVGIGDVRVKCIVVVVCACGVSHSERGKGGAPVERGKVIVVVDGMNDDKTKERVETGEDRGNCVSHRPRSNLFS